MEIGIISVGELAICIANKCNLTAGNFVYMYIIQTFCIRILGLERRFKFILRTFIHILIHRSLSFSITHRFQVFLVFMHILLKFFIFLILFDKFIIISTVHLKGIITSTHELPSSNHLPSIETIFSKIIDRMEIYRGIVER